ncbi:glycosyltransferase family 4 protein [Engelhardtia mirabilis]|uniref:GDP-mannose-dependent alpha-(1-6)-phosphatidylinositol monomannoside mannosyltransferase n=1 Tax=Engelhardtia mirabilis TaxID=2528011 RepID=A0A518BJH9_9BACT|nr:GDP-mannose-dependent alpha-(1-6)-phosphatidylinositol monomannoside mannosyltransferase [Planctomycetes bacterium Pla133]QDV01464.1 GDP-mannose-dependent alpha-(1-6)-phosphatidylinositol monomannoside mannosyltransferase [Planctomycetes bacterium Pla86]
MARILFVNQYYWPDVASTGQHLTDLAEHLAAHGHEVRVVCSRGKYDRGQAQAPAREVRAGVEIRRLRATSFGKRRTLVHRALDYVSFHALAAFEVARSRWADVVVTLTTPPLLGLCGRLAQITSGAKHVHFVMDLHPDAEFELGMVSPRSALGRLLDWGCGHPMRRAEANVVLGPYQGARVAAKGVDADRIHEIPVWSRADEVTPIDHADNPLREAQGWSERFVVMYSGNAGLVHQFEELLDAAQRLDREAPEVLFAFVGGGPRRPEIEAQARALGLSNVSFADYVPREQLSHSLCAADVHFMSLRPEQTGVAVPGKLQGILASARPVLFVGAERCESADTIRDARAGLTFTPGDGQALADAILALRAEPDRRRMMGERGRAAFLETFEQGRCCEAWRLLLEEICGSSVEVEPLPLARAA